MRAGTGIRVAMRSLRAHKLRSASTMLGIVIGVAAVITMVAVGQGAQQRIAEQLRSLGANLLLVTPGARTKEGVRLKAGSLASLTVEDARAIGSESPFVVATGAYLSGRSQVIAGNKNWSTLIAGVSLGFLAAREWPVARGQGLSDAHLEAAAKVVVLGRTVARALFSEAEPIGRAVRIRNTPFVVIGVLARKGQNAAGRDQDDVVMMPLTTARIRILGRGRVRSNAVHGILVKVVAHDRMGTAAAEVRALLRQRHRLWPDQKNDFRIRDMTAVAKTRKAALRQFTWLVAIIASVSLVVGGIGIMNTMVVSINERTREIGIRMAVGAEPRDLRRQFLTESLALSGIGGAVGVAAGIGAAALVTQWLGWATVIRPMTVLVAFGFSAVIGVVFGLYPAIKAARLDPIEALRAE